MNELNKSQRWDATDYAFLEFGRRKSYTQAEIAQAMERTIGSVTNKSHQLSLWQKGLLIESSKKHKMIKKAMQLAFAVQTNTRGDQHTFWMKKLCKTRNIEYKVSDIPEEKEEEPVITPPPIDTTVKEALPPVLQLTINTEAIIAIVKAWKGYQ